MKRDEFSLKTSGTQKRKGQTTLQILINHGNQRKKNLSLFSLIEVLFKDQLNLLTGILRFSKIDLTSATIRLTKKKSISISAAGAI